MVRCPGCGEENPPKFRLCGYCGTPLGTAPAALPAHEVRKTVTIVFSDLKGSTALGERLDPEALHEVKERYFGAMSAEIAKHGGKIEKYIGDAIMAVFGLPRAHEDDALRAVRAAAGMQAALRRVNDDLLARYGVALANRTGVNTGEVVANVDPGADQKLATGDAVNVAARLEQAAPENEIYLGEVTYLLVRDAVEVESVEPLELKGKLERVAAYRLVSARGIDGNLRRTDTPVVGREAELAALEAIYRDVREASTSRLVTVIGDAGMGKSRLVREVIDHLAAAAHVLRGRCLPYGDGITFWPLRQMVCEAADVREDDPPELAREKVLALVGDDDVAARLASTTGLSATPFPLHDLYWGVRKFFEALACDRPLVAVIDDIHWAEPAFLDLLEHIVDAAGGSPILLLATSRHDLLEERPQWGDRAGSTRLVLKPLSDEAAGQVVANLLGSAGLPRDVVERIVKAAEGNPLYVEQMLSMLIDSQALRLQGGRWTRGERYSDILVPPTIHALLEARLDKLGREERAAVEPASVIGLEFPQPAVKALAPEAVRPTIEQHLSTLSRKQFIQPAVAESEAIYRFHHQMVRDTVYNGLLKRARATLHADFVRWADQVNAERGRGLEFEAILGYHLEQAHHYLRELGPLDDNGVAIGNDAARRLSSAGRRAFARGDMNAAANLLRRAAALLPEADPMRLALLPELGEALLVDGDFAAARSVLDEAATLAERASEPRVHAASQLTRMLVSLYSGEQRKDWGEQTLRRTYELMPVLEREGAHNELAAAWRLVMIVQGMGGRYQLASEAIEHSSRHARLAGNEQLVARNGVNLAMAALFGPTPVPQAIARCEQLLADGLGNRHVECTILGILAQLKAMNGELGPARDLYRRARALLRDFGQGLYAAATGIDLARVELCGGDLGLAEREVRADYEFLSGIGETNFLPTVAALLSRLVRDQGRDDEAFELTKAAEQATADDDVESQALWRAVRAPIVGRRGDLAAAHELARGAATLVQATESPWLRADVLVELAAVLTLADRLSEARQVLDEAIGLYALKGNVVAVERLRA